MLSSTISVKASVYVICVITDKNNVSVVIKNQYKVIIEEFNWFSIYKEHSNKIPEV